MTPTSEPPVGGARTWAAMFAEQVVREAPAVIIDDRVLSYAELAATASTADHWLESIGAPDGLPVPTLLTTSSDAIALAVAGACSDRPLAPLNPRLTARELRDVVATLDGPVIVADETSVDIATVVARELGRTVAVLDRLRPSPVTTLDFERPEDSTAVVLHTSGTTGSPKQVAITQRKLALRALRQGGVMGLGPGKKYVAFSPFPHIAGLGTLLIALGLGAAAIPAQFGVEAWRRAAAHRPTHAHLVPAMIEQLLTADALAMPTLEVLLYGASPIRPDTLRAAMGVLARTDLLNMYGQTEGSPLTYLDGDDHRRALAGHPELLLTVGRPVAGVELRIESPTADGRGEICARADHMFVSGSDGWLRTGDMGVLDENGYLRIVGRKGDLIIRGGENVYPAEVETILLEHPDISQVAVAGADDDRLGQTVRAFVVPADRDHLPDTAALRAFARERLAGFKVPASWVFLDELPRTSIGKIRIPPGWRGREVPADTRPGGGSP